MSEPFYICRVWADADAARFSYLSKGCGWCKKFSDARTFPSREAANNHLNGRSGSIWSESELKASPYYQAEMKSLSSEQLTKIQTEGRAAAKARFAKPSSVEVLKPTKLVPAVNLQSGNDAAAAKQLNKLFADAQNGMRRVLALGLFAWEIKEGQLDHGEFGAWLAKHCPKLATENSITGKPVPSRALSGYMELTKNVLESCGCPSIKNYLATVAKFADDANLKPGQFLLIADKKVPESLAPMREKIFSLVDGKTQRALFMEFKQCEEDSAKPKRGRLKGQGGATKEQRANAEELERQERITERTLKAEEIADWLIEMSDDAGFGEIAGTAELDILDRAMEKARGYIKHHGGGK